MAIVNYTINPAPDGAATNPQKAYINYLVKRLTDWRKAGQRFGQKFSGQNSEVVTTKILQSQLGGSLFEPARFEEICEFIKAKIDATILGKQKAARGQRSYHSFEDDGVAKAESRKQKAKINFHPVSPEAQENGRGTSREASQGVSESSNKAPSQCLETVVAPDDSFVTVAAVCDRCEGDAGTAPLQDDGHRPPLQGDATLSERQQLEAASRRVMLVSAQPFLQSGLSVAEAARAVGVHKLILHRTLQLAPAAGAGRITSAEKCRRLLLLPVEHLAPGCGGGKESAFAALLKVPEIVAELHRLYAATLGASGPQAMNDRRTGSMALTLKRLGDFQMVPPHLAEKLSGGSQPAVLMNYLKRTWTPEMEAKYRGQKHYNQSTVVGRRDLVEELADGSQVPLTPGKVWVFDDMSSNLPFWFDCDAAVANGADKGVKQLVERHGCALGRQGLYAWDWASGAWLGVDLIGRLRDAYRASDILRFMRKLMMLYGKPDKIVLERGTWQSHAISGWKIEDNGSVLEVEDGVLLPDMATDEQAKISDGIHALGIEIIYTYTSRGKPIEGAFNYLQSIVPTMCNPGEAMNIGRHAGEFEWSAKAHLRAGNGVLHPRDLRFVHIDRLADLTLQAMTWDGSHDKARRNGKPLEILAQQLNNFALPALSERDLAVFLPHKGDIMIRGGLISPLGHQFGHAETFAGLGDGVRVDYAFDPDEPTLGAAIYSAKGFLCWANYIPAGPVISARDRSEEIGPKYLKAYKAAHRTAFRALDLKSLTPVIIAERRDGAGQVVTMANRPQTSAAGEAQAGRSGRAQMPQRRVESESPEFKRRSALQDFAEDALASIQD